MTTILISTIVALSIIAIAAIMIANWMRSCEEQNRRIRDIQIEIEMAQQKMKPGQEIECFIFIDGQCVGSVTSKRTATEYHIYTSPFDERPMNQLIEEAKDILNQKHGDQVD